MLKGLPAQIAAVLHSRRGQRNLRVLARFFLVLAAMISVFSVGFHTLMLREGQDHTWLTALYWTLTVMSTLGFGDITFQSDLGRAFSIVVLLSGMLFLLVLLPFTFIEFFYGPWMASQAEQRAPRKLPSDTRGHVLLTHYEEVSAALIRRLEQYQVPWALIVPRLEDTLRLHDMGLNVVRGDLDDPVTWKRVRVENAALVASNASDVTNTSVAFTVREQNAEIPIVTTASEEAAVDILKLAGSSFVLRLEEMIGQSFARRTLGGDAMSHVIGQFDELLIAEATAHRTPLVGKTLRENRLREKVGVTVVGLWERGHFEPAQPESVIQENSVLVLAGSREHLFRYDELFCIYNVSGAPVVILGGGRVGRATARALERREMEYRIVEVQPELVEDSEKWVLGSAADLEVLEKAGIRETSTVIITPNDDDLNVYLTIYCRQLRPEIQILARATNERNVATLHRAGADSVLSYASMGASTVINLLKRNRILTVAEGLDLFSLAVPEALAGRTIAESSIREDTGCSVVAIRTGGATQVVPGPDERLPADGEIVLIGTAEAEKIFLGRHGKGETPAA